MKQRIISKQWFRKTPISMKFDEVYWDAKRDSKLPPSAPKELIANWKIKLLFNNFYLCSLEILSDKFIIFVSSSKFYFFKIWRTY